MSTRKVGFVENIFASRLRSVRLASGQSQDAIAKKLSILVNKPIHQQKYQRIESGKNEPDLELLSKICLCFNVSADWLLGLTDENKRPEPRIPEKLENLKALGESAKDVIGKLQNALNALDKTI